MTLRSDETWHRLLEWTNGQGVSERLAAQALIADGFEHVDPSHPLGGKDGGKDAVCTRDGKQWVAGVYFPRGQQTFSAIEEKFLADLESAKKHGQAFVFVTNQELRLAEREQLKKAWPEGETVIHHLESLTTILDQPAMREVRKQFLAIDWDEVASGGRGGEAQAKSGGDATGGAGGEAGPFGRGGRGGDAVAEGEGSIAKGGPGGGGGLTPGGPGTEAQAKGGVSFGGEGGGGNRHDGRAGEPGRSGAELAGMCGSIGRGGRGCNTAAYEGKQVTIRRLLKSYYSLEPPPELLADFNLAVPIEWLNEELATSGANWRVSINGNGVFEFQTLEGVPTVTPHVPDEVSTPSPSTEGLALIICNRIEHEPWFAARLLDVFDMLESKSFPQTFGPFAVYFLLSGAGAVPWSLTLESPSGEVLVARSGSADDWGLLGTWHASLTITEFQVRETGIHRWRLTSGGAVLLQRTLLVRIEPPTSE